VHKIEPWRLRIVLRLKRSNLPRTRAHIHSLPEVPVEVARQAAIDHSGTQPGSAAQPGAALLKEGRFPALPQPSLRDAYLAPVAFLSSPIPNQGPGIPRAHTTIPGWEEIPRNAFENGVDARLTSTAMVSSSPDGAALKSLVRFAWGCAG
jgi:hypothetical protein